MANKLKKCELCGKTGQAIEMLICGGPFTYLCPDCKKLADEVIQRYLEMLNELAFNKVATIILKERGKRHGE